MLTLRPTGNTALTPCYIADRYGKGACRHAGDKARAQRNYLAGVAVANDMLRRGLISEADFSALETAFCRKNTGLYFRYEKPCLSPTLLITQTDEGSGSAATSAGDNPTGSAGACPAKRGAL